MGDLTLYWNIWGICMAVGLGLAGVFAVVKFIRNK